VRGGCCPASTISLGRVASRENVTESIDVVGEAARSAARQAEGDSPPGSCVLVRKREIGAVGKWETCFWFSTLSSALVAGAVGMWESRLLLARFPRGSWKGWEACLLAFHPFHSAGISTALSQCFAGAGQASGSAGRPLAKISALSLEPSTS